MTRRERCYCGDCAQCGRADGVAGCDVCGAPCSPREGLCERCMSEFIDEMERRERAR